MESTKSTGNQPEKKFSTGAISATVWKNTGQNKKTGEPVEFRTITLQRSYTDKEGKWQNTGTMRVNDIPKANLVLQKAYEYLVLKGQDSKNSKTDSEEGVEIPIEDIVM